MKKLIYIMGFVACLTACSQSEDYKLIRQEVLTVHDKLMIDGEQAYNNKARLDKLIQKIDSLKEAHPEIDTIKEKEQLEHLRTGLKDADAQMNSWMENFDAELGKKSKAEAVVYFKSEMLKINQLDSLYSRLIKESDSYLKRF